MRVNLEIKRNNGEVFLLNDDVYTRSWEIFCSKIEQLVNLDNGIETIRSITYDLDGERVELLETKDVIDIYNGETFYIQIDSFPQVDISLLPPIEKANHLLRQAKRSQLITGDEWCIIASEWCDRIAQVGLSFLFVCKSF